MAEAARSSPKLLKIVIMLALVLAVSFLYWNFLLKPMLDDINRSQAAIGKLVNDTAALNRKLAQKPAVEQEWSELQEDSKRMEVLIPSLEVLPWALGNLEELLESFPVTVQSLRAGEINVQGQHAEISMELGVSGRDADLLSLLENLEDFIHRVVIERVSWSRSGDSSRLSLQFRLVLLP